MPSQCTWESSSVSVYDDNVVYLGMSDNQEPIENE